ncbi:MAG: hypothetical protein OXE76_04730 [Alphaproteobacteria bacterium]|nr:hypothetical protein [Alphaproteobacteria bacterium]
MPGAFRCCSHALLPFLAAVFMSGAAMADALLKEPTSIGSAGSDNTERLSAAADNRSASSAAGPSGRQADSLPAAPASPSGFSVAAYEPAVLRVFECPRQAIARMLSSAVNEAQFSEALELEREVLVLCRDRQAILKELVGSEIELAAVLRKSATARAAEALKLETARREADARVRAAHEAMLEAARAEHAREEAATRTLEPKRVSATPPEPPRDYGWFAVMGRGEALRASVTDGANVWRVEAGDSLPGGVRIVAVEARPPGVRVTGWTSGRLPYRARGGR